MIRSAFKIAFALVALFMASRTGSTEKRSGPVTSAGGEQAAAKAAEQGIRRYERLLFEETGEDLAEKLKKEAHLYEVFLGDGDIGENGLRQLREFIAAQNNREAYDAVMKAYPDLTSLEKDLKSMFDLFEASFPDRKRPQVYTYVSGYDFTMPVRYADSVMIIAIDMFLGQGYEMYNKLGIPLYISQRFTPDHILPASTREISLSIIPEKEGAYTLLDAMIEQGKTLYFADAMTPGISDYIKIGFSPEQLQWCKKNESNIWQFVIENELLYKTDSRAMSMFMVDGPFTSSFSQESPSRTGAWLGWQIVRAYMQKNKAGLAALLNNLDAQEILEKSGYKPRRS